MTEKEKWTEGDRVTVVRQGLVLEGFVNVIDKKNGMLHIHTDRGPVTVLNGSKLLTRIVDEPVAEEEPKKDEKPSRV